MRTTIYLIRHGESTHNRSANALSGTSDVPLTARGEDQCRQLAALFQRQPPIEAVYTSPLRRARQSARLIFPQISAQTSEGLAELNYGKYEGVVAAERPEDPIIAQWNTHPGDLAFPGGDSIPDFARRYHDNLAALSRKSIGKTLACITHRSAIRLMAARVIGLDLDHFRGLPCANASITELSFSLKEGFRLVTLNRHLGL
jgi:broad specificity phosphatase PhoE